MTQNIFPGEFEPVHVAVNCFVCPPAGKGKMRVVRLRRATVRALIHHQVAAARFDRELESLHGLLYLAKVFRLFIAAQPDAEHFEPVGHLACDALHILRTGFFCGVCHDPLRLALCR